MPEKSPSPCPTKSLVNWILRSAVKIYMQLKWMSPTVVWNIIWKRSKRGVEVTSEPEPENHLEF